MNAKLKYLDIIFGPYSNWWFQREIQGVQAHVLLAVFFVTLELTALYFILISNYVPYIMQFWLTNAFSEILNTNDDVDSNAKILLCWKLPFH